MRTLGAKLWIPAVGGMMVLAACAPREWLLPKVGIDPPALRDFPADFKPPLSNETGTPMVGFGGNGGGVHHTPIIFIHGNTVSARFWLPAREYFKNAGYTDDEVWALGYGWDNVRYFDSDDLSVPSVDRIVDSVTAYLSQKTGRPIRQVDIVAHSLGVTLVRQWMKQTNSWHKVRNFIGACGANQGVWTAWPDTRGQNRVVSWELYPGSPWLAQLNRGGETPGPTRYMTLYDGTGWGDVLFPPPYQDASALKGAHNVAYNREHDTYYGHLELPREPGTMEAMLEFIKQAPEPLPEAEPPKIVRDGNGVHADQPEAKLYCTTDGTYPDATTRGAAQVTLGELATYTCYARNRKSGLASPMARYLATAPAAPAQASAVTQPEPAQAEPPKAETAQVETAQVETVKAPPLTLTATPKAGVFEEPVRVELKASDPGAIIVYTTGGGTPDSGSPLYTEPVYVPGPLTLTALAIAPDGRTSEPLKLDYDISLEKAEADHTLQRQFDPRVRPHYAGQRKVGR